MSSAMFATGEAERVRQDWSTGNSQRRTGQKKYGSVLASRPFNGGCVVFIGARNAWCNASTGSKCLRNLALVCEH
eukprot:1134682-Pyramimonas_sp.AAC.3